MIQCLRCKHWKQIVGKAAGKSVSLAFRVAPESAERLEALSAATDRPRSWLLEQALDTYLDEQAWQIAQIEEGLGDTDAGRTIPHKRIREWLLTWGSDAEAEPPV